ncbi:GNAT family N-acetyltransferase [Caulobacter mirabilis]|uniref:GNAT family N-acetyltransferase n=1 Tax=Caulobacter mirabilis TaxID=69666 RepID=A0A2D2AZS0_9CAUL|nr:GNAT family N-acetyltransferase [Caulobacter mirabilis]ATQ43508.1 GNAT family N-acetyltransferase [Caulobacter mirabilis]
MKPSEDRDAALGADPDVVAAWVAGWALSRGVPPPVAAYGGLRVDVGAPDQKARYVFAAPSPSVERASREILEPHVFIKVAAPPEAVEPWLAEGWILQPLGFLMTTDGLEAGGVGLPDGYRFEVDVTPGGHTVSALAEDGEVGANGRVLLAGTTAVFDQIITHPDHRRRGLGRAVMGRLGAVAAENGATKGSLVATPDGRALYSTLGWRLHSLFTTFVRE